jgi:HSP20 family protein
MSIIRWSPFRELSAVQREMNRVFEDNLLRSEREDWLGGSWAPQVDIFEDENQIKVTAALPGLDQKDVKVNIENNILTISGERKLEHEDQRENYTRVEQYYGGFTRSFTLPHTVDSGKTEAKMEKGVLTIIFPRREDAKPKQIEVKVN